MHLNLSTAGELDAFEITITVLSCLSIAEFVWKVTFITPCLPGKTGSVGVSTKVQAHATLVSLIMRGWFPVLVNLYWKLSVSPCLTKPKC